MTAETHQRGGVVARLGLSDAVRLLTGASTFGLAAEPRLELNQVTLSDGPTGVRGAQFDGASHAALLPNATLLAASWSAEAAHAVGDILAEEAMRQGVHVVLGPVINLHRSPLGGRLFEAFSEDPLLTGRLAAGYVRGLQERGVGACPKHLVGNESETARNELNCVMSEATLREVYLLPFEIVVEDADPWTMMASYNSVNGVTATENAHVNVDILREEWGWTGVLMSDWHATRSSAAAALGGLDLVMPGPTGPWGEALVEDVRAGVVPPSVIDQHAARLLRLAERVGALGQGWRPKSSFPAPESPQRRRQLRELATDGMVVLRNDAALPITRPSRVALIGRHAIDTVCMGGGSVRVNPPHQVSIADALREELGEALRVVDGVEVSDAWFGRGRVALTHPVTGAPGIAVHHETHEGELLRATSSPTGLLAVEPEGHERTLQKLVLSGHVAGDGVTRLGVCGIGAWQVWVDDRLVGNPLLATATSDPGESMFHPPTWTMELDVRSGAVVRAELMASARPSDGSAGDVGSIEPGMKGLMCAPAARDTDDALREAAAAARNADVAIVVIGLTPEQETEGADKTTLALPGDQDLLVQTVAAAAPRTVVVVNAATPVLMPWADSVDAILVAGLPGQEGGYAVADALLGLREPAGRLVTSWPRTDGNWPGWTTTPVDGCLRYDEGSFIGHRGLWAEENRPAFWFGEGQGFGSWDYLSADLSDDVPPGSDAPRQVRVTIRNTADRQSREVVQLYWEPAEKAQPIRLVGWTAATVPAGELAVVHVAPDARMWRRWDEHAQQWGQLRKGGDLVVARGLGDVRHRLPLG